MEIVSTKIVNGKKMFLIEDNDSQGRVFAQGGKPIKKENISYYNPYYVDIKGINSSDNVSTKSTPSKKITPQELKQIKESPTKVGNIVLKEKQEKAQRLKEAEEAYQKRKAGAPITPELLAQETQAIGDKISLQNLPYAGKYIPDILDVTGGLGSMASSLGRMPLNIKQRNYGQAALSVAIPLGVGALAGIGTQNTGQFVNNLINPFAGTGQIINKIGNKYLPNAYKLNPFAFKPNSNNFYRQVDNTTYNEALESGLIKGKQDIDMTGGEGIINLNKAFGDDAYYNKGSLYYKENKNLPYLFEAKLGEESFIPKVNGRTRKYTTENTSVRVSKKPLSINNPNITTYKKDWLQGYKEVPKPQQTFKSAIGNNGMFNMTNPLAGIKLKANLPEGTVINGVSLNPFKGKIDKKIELIPVPSKFRGEDAYNIKYGDKFIGDFDFEKINDRYVPFSISIDKEYRGQGLGKEAYEVANKLLKSQGKGSLHSSGFFIGDNAKHVWRSLEKTGKAEKIGEDSWKFLKFGGTVKVLDTKIEKNKKYYLINE